MDPQIRHAIQNPKPTSALPVEQVSLGLLQHGLGKAGGARGEVEQAVMRLLGHGGGAIGAHRGAGSDLRAGGAVT